MSMVNQLKTIVQKIVDEFPSISVLYLFGSHASGEPGAASDLDIAVFTDGNENITMDLELGLFIQQQLNRPVDVVILQKASPVLQHEVLRNKIRMFEKDPVQRALMENKAFRSFIDARHFQDKRFTLNNGSITMKSRMLPERRMKQDYKSGL
jgi:uncharacterized protein